nr:type I-E CRISPR-associated protein Cse1/CasA [uncultured Holophaga sp.]
MKRFNLIDEPWIPVRFLEGARGELGILETLRRAEEIAVLEDPSPLVTAALHRLLLAVLYRALEGPCDIEEARALFENGLPLQRIESYLETWRERFWLFHDRYPFGQIAEFGPKAWRAWTVLATEHNADNAKVLFDHIDVQEPGSITAGPAARWLVACQTFAVSSGKSELAHTGTAPSATGAMIIPIGPNLMHTLLFALVPQRRAILKEDRPLWEQNPTPVGDLAKGASRALVGLSDRFTWRSRTIRIRDTDEAVEQVALASGVQFDPSDQRDPMFAYRLVKDKGIFPVSFRDRGIWRDFDSLLPDQESLAPQAIQHALEMSGGDPAGLPGRVMVLGQSNDKAKIEFWRMECFALPGALASNLGIRSDIRGFLDRAETTGSALWAGCATFARQVISHGGPDPDKKDVHNFIAQMPCLPAYWARLEAAFHALLQAFQPESDPEVIRRDWLQSVHRALRGAWGLHASSARQGDVWSIRALVQAEGLIARELKKLDQDIRDINAYLAKETL